jgi:hypothetical protein
MLQWNWHSSWNTLEVPCKITGRCVSLKAQYSGMWDL